MYRDDSAKQHTCRNKVKVQHACRQRQGMIACNNPNMRNPISTPTSVITKRVFVCYDFRKIHTISLTTVCHRVCTLFYSTITHSRSEILSNRHTHTTTTVTLAAPRVNHSPLCGPCHVQNLYTGTTQESVIATLTMHALARQAHFCFHSVPMACTCIYNLDVALLFHFQVSFQT